VQHRTKTKKPRLWAATPGAVDRNHYMSKRDRITAQPETRRLAIEATYRHIMDINQCRVAFGWPPDSMREYRKEEERRLRELRALGLRI
jgi:hypothetical protein